MRGTFNQGWWNCFETFAAELLAVDAYGEGICVRVLDAAGITYRECEYRLRFGFYSSKVKEIVRGYMLSIKDK